jgi:hypothetical protein
MLFNFFSLFFYVVRSFTSCRPEIISDFKHNIFLRITIDRPNPHSIHWWFWKLHSCRLLEPHKDHPIWRRTCCLCVLTWLLGIVIPWQHLLLGITAVTPSCWKLCKFRLDNILIVVLLQDAFNLKFQVFFRHRRTLSSSESPSWIAILRDEIWHSSGRTTSTLYTKENGVVWVGIRNVIRQAHNASPIISC